MIAIVNVSDLIGTKFVSALAVLAYALFTDDITLLKICFLKPGS